MNTTKHRTLAIAATLVAAVAWAAPVRGQAIEQELQQAGQRLESARESSLDCIAPKSFGQAVAKYDDARARFEKGGKIEEIRARLQEMNTSLDRCEELEEIGHVILRDALVARADATKHGAPTLQPKMWETAEKAIQNAGGKIEGGDQNGARTEAGKANSLYRDAEFEAIRKDVLQEVWDLQVQAKEQKAPERAPTTLAAAEQALAAAEASVKKDRYARKENDALARKAKDAYQHTLDVCAKVAKMDADRKTAPEEVILGYEAELAKVAKAVGAEVSFAHGPEAVTGEILAAAKRREVERNKLEAKIESLEQQVASLEGDMKGARSELATLSDRDALLQKKEKQELRMQEVQAVFKKEEAAVLLSGDQLIIRMYGLSFPSGSAEIRPENFGLLSKLRQVLKTFPDSPIEIEGHTDSQGAAERNKTLSQARADAVREYLLANMTVDEDRVGAVGYGEDRPIANNETEEGRAKNRRIDLTLDLPAN